MLPLNLTGKFKKNILICAVDFTLKELKSLRVKQRYPFRDQQYNGQFLFSDRPLNLFIHIYNMLYFL